MTDFDKRELTFDELEIVAGGKTSKPNEFILINRPPPPPIFSGKLA